MVQTELPGRDRPRQSSQQPRPSAWISRTQTTPYAPASRHRTVGAIGSLFLRWFLERRNQTIKSTWSQSMTRSWTPREDGPPCWPLGPRDGRQTPARTGPRAGPLPHAGGESGDMPEGETGREAGRPGGRADGRRTGLALRSRTRGRRRRGQEHETWVQRSPVPTAAPTPWREGRRPRGEDGAGRVDSSFPGA